METSIQKSCFSHKEEIFNQTVEIAVENDFTLPDYLPEINKILKCRSMPRVISKNVNGQNLSVEGIVNFNFMYCGEDNKLISYECEIPFSKVFELGNDISSAVFYVSVKTAYLNCRPISERKIDIRSAVALTVKAFVKKNCEVICDVESENLQLKRSAFPMINTIGVNEKSIIIEEELELNSSQNPICRILRYDGNGVVDEIRTVNNKVIVKGRLNVDILYSTADDSCYECYKASVPFSQIVDIEGINDNCKCNSKVDIVYLNLSIKNDDENKTMLLNSKLNITVESYCDGEISGISDCYSTKEEVTLTRTQVSVNEIIDSVKETYLYSEKFDFSEGMLSEIIDLWVNSNVVNAKISNNTVLSECDVFLNLISRDTDSNIRFFEKTGKFSYTFNLDTDIPDGSFAEVCISPISVSYTTLTDSVLELRIEYTVTLTLQNTVTKSFITDIKKDEKKKSKNEFALIVYYAEKGESVWEISKKYNSNINDVYEFNSLSNDILEEKMKLLIPVY